MNMRGEVRGLGFREYEKGDRGGRDEGDEGVQSNAVQKGQRDNGSKCALLPGWRCWCMGVCNRKRLEMPTLKGFFTCSWRLAPQETGR
jgi:hypothetical protein